MTDARVRQRIDRWLDGDLPVDDEAALEQDLHDAPETLTLLADRALLHGLLRDLTGRPVVVPAAVERRRKVVRSVAWSALGLVVCGVLGTLLVLPTADAGSADVVQKALDRSRDDSARRYSVRVEPAFPRLWAAQSRPLPPVSTLWVRDTRFVQSTEIDGRTLAWGRDARGAVWFTVSPGTVAVFGADETPDPLRDACDLRTLDQATLLETLLADFDLRRVGGNRFTNTIVARPRDGESRFGRVWIVIERESLRVRSLVVERRHRGRKTATVHFTLEETAPRDDAIYEWPGHVAPDAEILDRSAGRAARRSLLTEFLRLLKQEPAES
jgi:hypothetical protein